MSNDSVHNSSPPPKISNVNKRRINKAKRQGIKTVDIEVDSGRVQGLPTIITEPSQLQVAGPPDIRMTTANFPQLHNINLQHNITHFTTQNFPPQILLPRGGGGRPMSVRDSSNDSTSSGMDEIDATVCDNVTELISDKDDDSVVVNKDIMMPQENSPDSGRDTPDDIESDGHAGVAIHRVSTSETSDIYTKTAGPKLDSACASESEVLSTPVETQEADLAAETSMAALRICDQSGESNDSNLFFLSRSFLLVLKLRRLNLA